MPSRPRAQSASGPEARGRSAERRPILTLTEDTSGGIHDTLIAACGGYRYALPDVEDCRDNCTDNLLERMDELGLMPMEVPSPPNLFMNIPWRSDGTLYFAAPPRSVPGGYVGLRAERDLVTAFSACPQDILPRRILRSRKRISKLERRHERGTDEA